MNATSPASPPASPAFIAGHLAVCAITWGSAFVFIKLMRGEVDPITISLVRAGLAAVAMAAFVLWLGQSPLPRRDEWQDWLVLGSVNGWVPNILVALALERMAAGMASMVQAATPLYTALLAHLLFADERLTRQKIFGVIVGFIGMMMLIGPRIGQGGAETWGLVLMLGVVAAYGSGNIYTRWRQSGSPERLALGQQTVSALSSLLLAVPTVGLIPTAVAMRDHTWALLALGLFSTAIPIAAFMRLITRAGATKASMVSYVAPATAVFMAVIVLGETLSVGQILGGVIILIGVAAMTLALPAREKATP